MTSEFVGRLGSRLLVFRGLSWFSGSGVNVFAPVRASVLVLVLVLALAASACATGGGSTSASGSAADKSAAASGGASTKADAPAEQRVDALAVATEGQINEAERRLDALEPDRAVELLDEADTGLRNPLMRRYPDDEFLQRRHSEVLARVPGVREEVRRRALAAAVKASTEAISAALDALEAATQPLRDKDPPDQDFAAARDRIADLDKHLEQGRALEPQDATYAKFATRSMKTLKSKRTYVETRHLAVRVMRSRRDIKATLSLVRDAFSAIARNDATDQAVGEVENALSSLQRVLDEGESLGPKDRSYSKYANGVRRSLQEDKVRLGRRRHEILVARQDDRVNAAVSVHRDVMKRVLAKDAVVADFDEADRTIDEVLKVLDGGEALQSKDRGYAKRAVATRRSMQLAKAQIAKRRIDVQIDEARARIGGLLGVLKAALAGILQDGTPDQAFSEADAAVGGVLTGTADVATLVSHDKRFAAFVMDARHRADAGRDLIAKRRLEEKVLLQRTELDGLNRALKDALVRVKAREPSDADFAVADEAAKALEQSLEKGEPLQVKSPPYSKYAIALRKTLQETRRVVSARRLAEAIRVRRESIEKARAETIKCVRAVESKKATQDDTKAAREAIVAYREQLQQGASLEGKDAQYRKYALASRNSAAKMQDRVDVAAKIVAFRVGPLAALENGKMEMRAAAAAPEPKDRKDAYAKSVAAFKTCRKDAAMLLGDAPILARTKFAMGRSTVAGKALPGQCAAELKTAEKNLKDAESSLAFYDGPGRSFRDGLERFDAAAGLSDPAEQKERYSASLGSFEACVSEGELLGRRNPDIKKRKFEVNQRKVTLSVVVGACRKQAAVIRKVLAKLEQDAAARASQSSGAGPKK